MGDTADGLGNAVDDADAAVEQGSSCQEAGNSHISPSLYIAAIRYRSPQIFANQPHSLQRISISHRIGIEGGIGFDGMGQCVHPVAAVTNVGSDVCRLGSRSARSGIRFS